MAEAIRAESQRRVNTAMPWRSVVGVRRRTLIINLPGTPDGARENLQVILSVLPYAIGKIRVTGGDCAP
jgi:molybdopterin biosynthesis enzyme MoaB